MPESVFAQVSGKQTPLYLALRYYRSAVPPFPCRNAKKENFPAHKVFAFSACGSSFPVFSCRRSGVMESGTGFRKQVIICPSMLFSAGSAAQFCGTANTDIRTTAAKNRSAIFMPPQELSSIKGSHQRLSFHGTVYFAQHVLQSAE